VRAGGWERALAIEHAAHTAAVSKPVLPLDERANATFSVTSAGISAVLETIASLFK
jgi:hypothetical protein